MTNVGAKSQHSEHERQKNALLSFISHQLTATVGVPIGLAFLLRSLTSVVRLAGGDILQSDTSKLLTEHHSFPLQTIAAVLIGFFAYKYTNSKTALWVWLLPCIVFAVLFATSHSPTVIESGLEWKAQHFFGSGCNPRQGCIDQVLFTLPLYTSVAYSVGAWMSRSEWFALTVS